MDAELNSILQNIKSLADQASQMQNGAEKADPETEQPGAGQAELPPEIAEKVLKYLKEMDKTPEEGEEADDDINKSDDEDEDDVKKSANGPTGDSSAEDRIDETTGEVNDKNINEVAKAIARMLVKKSAPKKSVNKSSDMATVAKALEFVVGELKVQKDFNNNILKGLGIADSILEAEKVEKSKAKPMDNNPAEVQKTLDFIKQLMGTSKEENSVSSVQGADHTIAKSLSANDGSLLMGMFPKSHK